MAAAMAEQAFRGGDGSGTDAPVAGSEPGHDPERLRLERDLYLGLLELTDREHPGPFLEEALGLIVRVLGAEQAYLEVSDPQDGPTWWRAVGYSAEEAELTRAIVSRGIIAEALARGEAIVCPSAILDPCFRKRPSVQASKIEAVLCVPILRQMPIGVLYLQGRRLAGAFADQEVEQAKTFARHLAPLVEGLFIRSRSQRQTDHVAPIRARLRMDDVVGVSEALARALREVEVAAPLDVGVLITGETGTGKTQLARLIHDNGPRRGRRFVELNCATLPENLFENELFGAHPGAHSSATRRIEGKVAAAEGGTLFFDDVQDLPLGAQAKLLQFLENKEYFPLGASTPLVADVRVIAATNTDLQEAVRERRFRSDLRFRLDVLRIRLPSLAERREDLIPLARCLCERAQRRHRLPRGELSPSAMRFIEASQWEGNVRELAHILETAAIRAAGEGATTIEERHLVRATSGESVAAHGHLTFQEETRRFQASLLQRALEAVDWNVTAAARSLDLTRAHVYNLIRAFRLTRRPPR